MNRRMTRGPLFATASTTGRTPRVALTLALAMFLCAAAPSAQKPALTVVIERNMTCFDQSTMGRLLIDNIEVAKTLELPWRDNKNDISRVPAGTYSAKMRVDGPRGWRVELLDVPGTRENIQLHVGNYASEIQGCILVGDSIARDPARKACMVTNSAAVVESIRARVEKIGDSSRRNISSMVDITVVIR